MKRIISILLAASLMVGLLAAAPVSAAPKATLTVAGAGKLGGLPQPEWTFSIKLSVVGEGTPVQIPPDIDTIQFDIESISGQIRLVNKVTDIIYTASTGAFSSKLIFIPSTNTIIVAADFTDSNGDLRSLSVSARDQGPKDSFFTISGGADITFGSVINGNLNIQYSAD